MFPHSWLIFCEFSTKMTFPVCVAQLNKVGCPLNFLKMSKWMSDVLWEGLERYGAHLQFKAETIDTQECLIPFSLYIEHVQNLSLAGISAQLESCESVRQ